MTTLGEICTIVMGQSPPSSAYNSKQEGLPFFQGKAEFTELHPVAVKWCTESNKIAEENDVLVSVRAPVGSTNIADQKCCIGRGLAALRYIRQYKFVFYFLRYIAKKLDEQGTGTTFRAISGDVLRNYPVNFPPLPEQRAIVAKIEQLFSELDQGIANLKKAQEQLKVYRQAVLKRAFEGELTRGWREQQPHLPSAIELLEQIASEREQAAKAQGKKLKQVKPISEQELTELPVLPEGWMWVKTAQIIDPINNGYTPASNFLNLDLGDIPFIKVYNLCFDGALNFKKNPTFIPRHIHEKDLLRSIVYPGDVLINIVGPPLGKVSIVSDKYPEWNVNQAIVLFRPNRLLISKYISYCLQNLKTIIWLENTSKATAGQYNIKVSTCREIPFPYCSPFEQSQIVQEIETRFSVCDNLESSITDSLEKAEALRQSILKKAFEGSLLSEAELQETRNAPDWEPAEQLLERIRAERKNNGLKQ